jgi:uncharacterized protein (TIGR03790 family)
MRLIVMLVVLLAGSPAAVLAVPAPPVDSVAVLFNSALPESGKLAATYLEARGIPGGNLIGLDMPVTQDISREEYETRIVAPLRQEFERREWWQRTKEPGGLTLPTRNRIRVLVTVRGVPLRIRQSPKAAGSSPSPTNPDPNNPFEGRDDASVDSELAMFGVEGVPAEGGLQNKYYKSDKPVAEANVPFMVLTARIDAASFATCERMIRDAVQVEKSGLWGMAYVDIANKFPQGDAWLEEVVKESNAAGIPTVVDRFNETLPKHYPMGEASLYYGWYDWSVSGPFLNPRFKFRPGAVAMHLHSFSGEQLGDTSKNWCAPLLERGAAVTVGNVYEPYLHLSHDFGVLHQRLLAGHSWVEACWMAMPVTSWQGIVLGDPLYRPFKHLNGTGTILKEDRDFRALRAAKLQWPHDPVERSSRIQQAAERNGSGLLTEAVGLELLERGLTAEAALQFRNARLRYVTGPDKLRQDFHLIGLDRRAGRLDMAIRELRDAKLRYGPIPEADAIQVWLDLLDPPKPAAAPTAAPK